jgi:large exoprotein involved in heme utilization and adhesion
VIINARDTAAFDGVGSNGRSSAVFSRVEQTGIGDGGDINIITGSLRVSNGAQLSASTFGQGKAGNVIINARDTAAFDGVGSDGRSSAIFSSVGRTGIGDGGDINITTGSLRVSNGAQLIADSNGQGNAGSVIINARDTVAFDGVDSNGISGGAFSNVEQTGIGDGGDINITTGSLSVTNGAQLQSVTSGQGNAGSVNINARNTVSFDGVSRNGYSSAVFSTVNPGAVGEGGDITIATGALSVTNGALLAASTRGQGKAGSVNINARDTVSFDGVGSNGFPSAAASTVENTAVGNGVGINITTGSLSVTNGAQLSASTRGQGDGGNITINTNTLSAVNGGQVLTTSRSSGKAGNITVNIAEGVTLSGSDRTYSDRFVNLHPDYQPDVVSGAGAASGLFASTSESSTGLGGDLRITTRQLNVRDGAQVNVSSEGSGNAGSLSVQADSIFLDNQGKLQASTASGEGGNINLQVRDLILMRDRGLISAEADNTGNGGNVIINAPFIVAVPAENSDIIANAFRGKGGNINITTSGIYGLEYRQELTLKSDINASSQFGVNGTVQINTPGIDPSRGLTNLPADLVDASNQIAQNCATGGRQVAQSEFIATGRGGLPPNPSDPLSPNAVWIDLDSTTEQAENRPSSPVANQPIKSTPVQNVEATGWVVNNKGQVVLTASVPTATHTSSGLTTAQCHDVP